MLIYVVEDDTSILKLIEYSLRSKGYEVNCFENGNDFFEKLNEKKPDIVLLDIMLPDIDGIEILKRLKEKDDNEDIWVVMITAKTSEYDIISALDSGADDYIKKPFSVMELLSRVGAIARRASTSEKDKNILEFNGIVMNNLKRVVTIDGKEVEFTFKEYELLKYLILNKNIVISREKLLNYIWGYDYEGETRTVDMHIKLLRDKLKEKRNYIKTIRGVGYMLSAKD
ncbi:MULTISPECIES: response regulator transcription factor [Peptoniphilus]|jgi:alkaline phosphatase synthesis transcriptional regulatory protein phoP|uniref:response regulator transcription factor n=1 Tax=Peptoniphilus TaxID=162289 RepID=UPI0002889003|nr:MULTISPECIES: response regulator transcription factor [Peptoniphilus]MBS6610343.1 response regulator transcription factor [Peptoniphilus harei]MDU1043628.1 response regulator transcription factor [Peptoniphilus rhinitidis]MDU1954543.1 response regulator transcription factor [Peptoniphilus lacydonensis]MDU2109282.1 response regulator transcription factor [Peptoniphilus lacydonensis]MDU2115414.1 response regulator transcription factor [Peptoniphilus lacydonensis]